MDFGLSSEQQLLQSTLRDFSKRELEPHIHGPRPRRGPAAASWCENSARWACSRRWSDPRFGGSGLDYVSLGIAHEEIARGDFNAAYVLLIAALVGAIIARNGDERQQAAMLPADLPRRGDRRARRHRAGRRLRCGAHQDAARGATAIPTYSMARKPPSRSRSSAATALVMARTGTLEQGARGVSAFYVDLNAPGVSRTRFRDLGSRAVGRGTSVLRFGARARRCAYRRGGRGLRPGDAGFRFQPLDDRPDVYRRRAAKRRRDLRIRHASARHSAEASRGSREFRSRSPRRRCKLRAARLLCYEALWRKDRGEPHGWISAGAKWWAPELAAQVLHQCLLLHGHLGF